MRAKILAERARHDVHNADKHDHPVLEHAEVESRAGNDEERSEQRARPAVGLFHDLGGQRAEVAEQRAQHHARQKRREANGHRADLEFRHGQRRGQEDEGNGHVETVCIGVEELFQLCEHPAAERAERKRTDDLDQRVDDDGDHVERAGIECLCDAERDCEHDQTDRIIQRDDRQQQIDQRALGLILAHNHERRGGGRRGGDGAEGDGLRNRQLAVCQQRDGDEGDIDQERRGKRLQNADHERLFSGVLQLGYAELAADGERDKAQRDLGNERQAVHIRLGREAESFNSKQAQAVRPDQDACDQICRHGRQLQRLCNAGHQQARKNRNGQRQQGTHFIFLHFFFFAHIIIHASGQNARSICGICLKSTRKFIQSAGLPADIKTVPPGGGTVCVFWGMTELLLAD